MTAHELLEQFFGLTQEEQREILKTIKNNVDESNGSEAKEKKNDQQS